MFSRLRHTKDGRIKVLNRHTKKAGTYVLSSLLYIIHEKVIMK